MLSRDQFGRMMVWAIVFSFLLLAALPALAQQQPPPPTQQPKPQQPAPAEAGGPQGDVGPIILPKKKDEAPPPPRPDKPKPIEGMPDVTITKNVNVVQVPVLVTTKDGQFIPGLKQDNFRVFEDGVQQKVTRMDVSSDAPITAVLLVEFANRGYQFMYDALNAAYTFVNFLKKDDWVAVISFDMRDYILTDFTQDKAQVQGALNQLRIPGFSETNVFDALYDTLDRVDRIDGRKYIVLISSGCDTFSRITYDKVLKKVKDTPNVTIFTISTGEVLRMWAESQGYGQGASIFPCSTNMDFLQADNQMSTFARLTGGRWFKPRFEAELPEIFHDVAANIRNQYVLTYHPTNPKLDGTFRKLKVEVVAPDGGPLKVKDQKGKNVKFQILARDGYTARHEVE